MLAVESSRVRISERSGSAFALHVRGPGFNPRHLQNSFLLDADCSSSKMNPVLWLGTHGGCSSVVERMLCMYEAPGSIPGISIILEMFQYTKTTF